MQNSCGFILIYLNLNIQTGKIFSYIKQAKEVIFLSKDIT